MLKGLPLKDAYVNASGTYVFELEDTEEKAQIFAIEFLNSECSKFDNQMRNLRKILKSRF
jgi:hypothetical protein